MLYALSADHGKVEWKKQIGALGAASPAYSHGVLFAVTLQKAPGVDQGEVLALRRKDGKLLWRFPLPGAARRRRSRAGRNVFVGSESGDLYALDRKTGKLDWHRRPPAPSRVGWRSRTASSTGRTTPARCSRSAPPTASSCGSRAPRG